MKPRFREDKDEAPKCPFCGRPLAMPQDIKTEAGSFMGGRCDCGAVFACDPTGHNVGEAYLDALTYACGGWNGVVNKKAAESCHEAVFNYDLRTHRLWEVRDVRRDYSGKIVFIGVGYGKK